MAQLKIGSFTIDTVYETDASSVFVNELEQATPAVMKKHPWLHPRYVDDAQRIKAVNQSFILQAGRNTIVLDTCVGNGRHITSMPEWGNLQTNYLGNLRKRIDPEDVTHVLNTHLHFDHIGWNTHKDTDSGKYVPTFPAAKYMFVEEELDYWLKGPEKELADDRDNIAVAVQPVIDAGLHTVIGSKGTVVDGVYLVPAPGHTPHHTCVLIESDGQSALYAGDLFHHPIQIAHPNWMSFDTDEHGAYESRMKILEQYADTDTIIISAHFAEPAWGRIVKSDKGYELVPV